MKTFVQPGESLALAIPYVGGATAGQGVLLGSIFGIAAFDGVQNATVECQTEGVFDVTKEPALAIAAGARVFWDNTNRRMTTTPIGNFPVGAAVLAAQAADTTVRVWIDGDAAVTPAANASRAISLVPTASANTDLTFVVPAGHVLRILQRTTTAYTGASATVQVGVTVGGAELVAAADIKAVASRSLTLVDANSASFTPLPAGTVYVRIVQTTPTAVGAGLLILEIAPTV